MEVNSSRVHAFGGWASPADQGAAREQTNQDSPIVCGTVFPILLGGYPDGAMVGLDTIMTFFPPRSQDETRVGDENI